MNVTCTLGKCPPGLFLFEGILCFKSEYLTALGRVEAYVVSSGEFFVGGTKTEEERRGLMVLPVILTSARDLS